MIAIIVRIFTGWEGWGALLAVLLIAAFLGGAFSGGVEVAPANPFYQLHESSTFDNGAREVGLFADKNGNEYPDALFFEYGSNDRDRYALNGMYTSLSGTVFVPGERRNKTDGAQLTIYGDGKRLWASSHMFIDSPAEDFNINVTGVQTLEFRYDGGALTWDLEIAIGNIKIGTDTISAPALSQIPTRLLDLPLKKSTFVCRYTHWAGDDYYGNHYEDSLFYLFGDEDDYDLYLLDGKFTELSGTIYIPTRRTVTSDEWCLDRMYYVMIFADGQLIYTSPQMAGGQPPITFNIDVSDCNELKIMYFGGAATWEMPVALADLLLT